MHLKQNCLQRTDNGAGVAGNFVVQMSKVACVTTKVPFMSLYASSFPLVLGRRMMSPAAMQAHGMSLFGRAMEVEERLRLYIISSSPPPAPF